MRIDDLFTSTKTHINTIILAEQCSEFVKNSRGKPLLKNLPTDYNDVHKVKVRKRKKAEQQLFDTSFNEAFEEQFCDLRERAVFANGLASFEPSTTPSLEPFYIFPIDGYKFLYSKEVENSNEDYKTVVDVLYQQFGSEKACDLIAEMLKFSYISDKLYEGIDEGAEIIIYNIPYFYAVRKSTIDDYNRLITKILPRTP